MGSRGPQPKQINWDQFEKLMTYDCTMREIAAFFDITTEWLDVLCQRQYSEKLSVLHDKRRLLGRVKLKKIRFEIAERGGPGAATMAIYLSKQLLGEKDAPIEPDPEAKKEQVHNVKIGFREFCLKAGYPAPFDKQIEMKDFVFNNTDPRLLLGSRGVGKTDYITILGVAYDIYLHELETTNLIVTKSKQRNGAIIQEIASALKCNGIELDKENASCIRVKGLIGKDHSVEALTIGSSARGRHPRRVLMDDPVTDEDISKAMRLKVKRKYNEIMKLCSNVAVIGQPAHAYDLYAELRPVVLKLEIPFGTIPELDHDLDAQRKAGVDESSIQASYFLKIDNDGTMPFSKIKYVDVFPHGDSVAFIDPSDGGDFTAISIIKSHFDGVAVFGKQWKKAWYHCIDEFVPILKARNVKKLCFETNKHGMQPIDQLRQVLSPHGIGVIGKYSDSNKHAVIMAAGSYAHKIHLSKDSDRSYTDHVVQYEYNAEFDDAPDSLARCLEWIGLIRGKK